MALGHTVKIHKNNNGLNRNIAYSYKRDNMSIWEVDMNDMNALISEVNKHCVLY